MSLFPYGVTIQIRPMHEGERDSRGNAIRTWPEYLWRDQPDCAIVPQYSADTRDRGRTHMVVVGQTLYAPYAVELGSGDRVFYEGDLYSIEGIVGRWRNPHTGEKVIAEVALTAVTEG